jgi:hypothetical protein
MKLYDSALASLLLQRGDALQLARRAIAEAPDAAAPRLLEANILAGSRDVRDFEAAGWAYARLGDLPMTERERAHTVALAAAIDGDPARACRVHDAILAHDPADMLSLWVADRIDYFLGNTQPLRDRAARSLADWPAARPGYHAVLGMHAFGLAECGDYAAAESAALRALELDPDDMRAEHALLHVLEMQGRAAEGVRRALNHRVNHLWWHRALFYLQLDEPREALRLYDERMALEGLPDLIDASALLWRFKLAGADVGARFEPLAARWSQYAEDAYCAFNDLHAMMAFAGAQRWNWAQRLLAAQERGLARARGANYDMTRLVGHPACRALAAFGRGDFRNAELLLRALPPVAHRIGGSHAQRDVLTLTRAAAAARRARPTQGVLHASFVPERLAAA